MRILHTNAAYWPFVGGAETYLRAMSERLVRDGHAVTVMTSDASGVQSFWDPRQPRLADGETTIHGVRVLRSRVGYLPLAPWSFYLLRRLATDLARMPFDARPLLGYWPGAVWPPWSITPFPRDPGGGKYSPEPECAGLSVAHGRPQRREMTAGQTGAGSSSAFGGCLLLPQIRSLLLLRPRRLGV